MTGALSGLRLAAQGMIIMLAACSSPNPALYTIAPVTGPELSNGPKVVLLQVISLEQYLERLQIVRSSENYRLDVMANDWWGEPLSAMLSRVLVAELGQRLPRSTVISEGGAVSASPDATVSLNVQRLDEDANNHLVLQAQASVSMKGRAPPVLRGFRLIVPPNAPGVAGEVAAISVAVGRLADGLAAMIVQNTAGK